MILAASLVPQLCTQGSELSERQFIVYRSRLTDAASSIVGNGCVLGVHVENFWTHAAIRTMTGATMLAQFSSLSSRRIAGYRYRGYISANQSIVHLGIRGQVSTNQVSAKVMTLSSISQFSAGISSATNATMQPSLMLTINVVPSYSIVVTVGNQTYTTDPGTGKVVVVAQQSNESFRVSVPQMVNVQAGVRITFKAWENGDTNNSRFATLTSNLTLTATYLRQYFVSVLSQYGAPTGSGWFDENSLDTVSINPTIDGGAGARYVFEGWSGGIAGDTDPISFQVTGPMNLTAIWATFNSMRLTFYDGNSTEISPTLLDGLTLSAPNGTVLILSNLRSNSSFWFEKGDYAVLTAYVYGVDVAGGTDSFTASPDGLARIQLELYTLSFSVRDRIFGYPIDGGIVTLVLPNGHVERTTINDGQAVFRYLPAALYSFNVSRGWSVAVNGAVSLPNESSTSIGLIEIPSLLLVLLSFGIALTAAIVFLRRHGRMRRRSIQARGESPYSDYWNKQDVQN